MGQYKGHLGGLDKVFKIRDRHHRIHRQILRQNEGLIFVFHTSTGQYIGVATFFLFFFFFFNPG